MTCSFNPGPEALEKMRRRGISTDEAKETANKGEKEYIDDDNNRFVGKKYRARYGRYGGIFIKQPCTIMCLTIYDTTQTKYHL